MCHWYTQLGEKNFAVLDMLLNPLVLAMTLQPKYSELREIYNASVVGKNGVREDGHVPSLE